MTIVISGFPGIGKSTMFRNNPDKVILDSDSSTFDKQGFPDNYIQHIKSVIHAGDTNIQMVSSHTQVRDALVANGIDFVLVYPSKECKQEYLHRYKERGSSPAFLELLHANFDTWVDECDAFRHAKKIVLGTGEYLDTRMNDIYQNHFTPHM